MVQKSEPLCNNKIDTKIQLTMHILHNNIIIHCLLAITATDKNKGVYCLTRNKKVVELGY